MAISGVVPRTIRPRCLGFGTRRILPIGTPCLAASCCRRLARRRAAIRRCRGWHGESSGGRPGIAVPSLTWGLRIGKARASRCLQRHSVDFALEVAATGSCDEHEICFPSRRAYNAGPIQFVQTMNRSRKMEHWGATAPTGWMVTPARFERATYRLGIWRSILLSYGAIQARNTGGGGAGLGANARRAAVPLRWPKILSSRGRASPAFGWRPFSGSVGLFRWHHREG